MMVVTICCLFATTVGAPRARADTSADFTAFSRSWYAHDFRIVVAEDGSSIALYTALGGSPGYSLIVEFSSVSDDERTAYGKVVVSTDEDLYRWLWGEPISLTFASPHSAYLQQYGTIVFVCSSGWSSEVPQPPCGA